MVNQLPDHGDMGNERTRAEGQHERRPKQPIACTRQNDQTLTVSAR